MANKDKAPKKEVSPGTKEVSPYKGIKSIGAGLKIGANNVLSKKEANSIAESTGKSFDKVLEKGLSKGFQIGNAAVNQSNRSYTSSRQGIWDSVLNDTFGQGATRKLGRDPLVGMRGLELGKKQTYGGEYKLNGTYTPLVSPKIKGVANPLGQTVADPLANTTLDSPVNTNTTGQESSIPTTDQPIDPLVDQPSGPGMGSDVASFATGWKSKKSRRANAGQKAQGFNSMTITNASGVGLNSGIGKSISNNMTTAGSGLGITPSRRANGIGLRINGRKGGYSKALQS